MGREEGDKLLNALLPFAQQMLANHGAFHPFGAYMSSTGEIVLLGAYDGKEYPKGKVLIDMDGWESAKGRTSKGIPGRWHLLRRAY